MGYHINQINTGKFFIEAKNKVKALKAIKSLKGNETIHDGSGDHFSWVSTEKFMKAKTLEAAMEEWRWEVENDNHGNIIDIAFRGEKLGDDDVLFLTISPFVKKDSHIDMKGEDGEIWRWYFENGTCKVQKANIKAINGTKIFPGQKNIYFK